MVNYKLLPIKIHFFLIALGTCPPYIYLGTYARQLGYSVDTIGCVLFLYPILAIFMKIGFGILTDKIRKLKLILFVSIIITSLSSGCLSFLQKRSDNTDVLIICNQNNTIVKLCDLNYSKELADFQLYKRDCQLQCNDNEKFSLMCLEWFSTGNSSKENTIDIKSCDDISGEIEFLNKSVMSEISEFKGETLGFNYIAA